MRDNEDADGEALDVLQQLQQLVGPDRRRRASAPRLRSWVWQVPSALILETIRTIERLRARVAALEREQARKRH